MELSDLEKITWQQKHMLDPYWYMVGANKRKIYDPFAIDVEFERVKDYEANMLRQISPEDYERHIGHLLVHKDPLKIYQSLLANGYPYAEEQDDGKQDKVKNSKDSQAEEAMDSSPKNCLQRIWQKLRKVIAMGIG